MRRLLLLSLSLLLIGPSCWAAVGHAADGQGFCSATGHAGNIAANCTGVATKTFTYTPIAANNGVLIAVGCSGTTTETTVTLTATGWTIAQVGSITGSSSSTWTALFKAYAPNTSAATFTVTWGAACNANFMNDLIGEFSSVDQTNFIDCTPGSTCLAATNTTGGCSGSVTPAGNNDAVWFACQDSLTAVGGSYTKGADDTQQDWAEWQILSGGAGVSKASAWTTSGGYAIVGVAIKPAAVTQVNMPPVVY